MRSTINRFIRYKMKKLKIIGIMLVFLLCSACAFVGCKGGSGEQSGIKVTYELCGGEYKNSNEAIIVYYRFPDNAKKLIRELPVEGSGKSTEKVSYAGYNFDGWYTGYSENNGEKTYSDKWNFDTNEVTEDGITLYAKWSPKTEYYFVLGYKNDKGEFESFTSVKTSAYTSYSDKLTEIQAAADSRTGYTAIGIKADEADLKAYCDENGKIKESETNVDIKVWVDYIEGDYVTIYSADDFSKLSLSSSWYKGKTVLLMKDVDCNGKSMNAYFDDLFNVAFGKRKFNGIESYDPDSTGNKYKIYGFTVDRGSSDLDAQTGLVVASVFKDFPTTDDSETPVTIKNVEFEGVVNIDVGDTRVKTLTLSLFANKLYNANVIGVKSNIEFRINKIHDDTEETPIKVVKAEHLFGVELGDEVLTTDSDFGRFNVKIAVKDKDGNTSYEDYDITD